MSILESVKKGVASATIAYTVHYTTLKLYNEFCVPDGVWGYIQGFVTIGSPFCQTGLDILKNTQVSYSTVLLVGLSRFVLDVFTAPSSEKSE